MGSISRRDFLKVGAGVSTFVVVSGLGLLEPRRADAVIGIDDAALGGLVLLVATLGGYAFSRSVANVSLDALGYGFSDFVSDVNNQSAAVTSAIADANNLGVELNRSNAENAAQSIAAGTGYFAEVMGNAATSGRVALDNFISGAGELPGVLRSLISSYIQSDMFSGEYAKTVAGVTSFGTDNKVLPFSFMLTTLGQITNMVNNGGTLTQTNAALFLVENWRSFSNNTAVGNVYFFDEMSNAMIIAGVSLIANITNGMYSIVRMRRTTDGISLYLQNLQSISSISYQINNSERYCTSGIVSGALPAVDRATDAPDVIGPGYDSLPLANDLVIDPSTDEVVSAGSLPLPTSIPDVFGDYVGTLNDILAGVIPGMVSLPVSVAEPVVVGTATGVQSMSITDAIAGDTSLSASLNPPVDPYPPYDPVEPPVDVPEGPWTPAVTLPFEQIWPFNMIYSFVELFEQLGGS